MVMVVSAQRVPPVSPAATNGPPEKAASGNSAELFVDELRRRNLSILIRAALIFNIAYVGWSLFDYLLAREYWTQFLSVRILASLINTALVVWIVKRRPDRTFEAFWIWLFVFGACIAPMLPVVSEYYLAYVMGFTIVIFGAGLLPLWSLRWATTNILAIVAVAAVSFARSDRPLPPDFFASVFFVLTAAALSLVFVAFKYQLALRDFDSRTALASTSKSLEQALQRLTHVDQMKTRFFGNISHELRTPLTLILAPLENLLASGADPQQEQALLVVQRNAQRLLRLIDDLLELSRLDAGGLRLNLSDLDLRTIARVVYENSHATAQAKQLEFSYLSSPSTRLVWADAHRMEIVITNLVGNAIKYTPASGSIQMEIADTESGVRLCVRNSGPGISAEDLPHVFERFFQAGERERRRQGGVGIGLTLAKELVELHSGKIEVTSEPGRGTEFSIFLAFGRDHIRPEAIERRRAARNSHPMRRAGDQQSVTSSRLDVTQPVATVPQSAPAKSPPAEKSGRVLVAEDTTELRSFIEDLLAREYVVLTAKDGEEAWQMFLRESPDLVLSDVMMPGKSGTELVRLIRNHPSLSATPVILLTAKGGSDATLEAYAAGADDFVSKPFHPSVLVARVRAQMRLRALSLRVAENAKFAAIGTMAAGILHEVRNPLNAVINGVALLARGDRSPESAKRLFDVVSDGAHRIQLITDALDTHSRPADRDQVAVCDVQKGLDSTVALLQHRLHNIGVHRSYDTNRTVAGAAAPIHQVFTNLVENAANAGAKNIWLHVFDRGDRVCVSIRDDGKGVPADAQNRIFDPFYTTAEPGKGSGLGLYLSKQIVSANNGTLRLEPTTQGAEFVLEFQAETAN